MRTVKGWAESNGFSYQFLGDELFDLISPALVQKTLEQKVIATDLARLYAIQNALEKYNRVVWLDADFLIFSPQNFILPGVENIPEGYMLGREVWVQSDHIKKSKLSAHVKVHNAFLLFDRGNSFLAFYLEHAERLLSRCHGRVPPQFIGPKLLTALHNVVQCPVFESAGMFSPLVVDDLLSGSEKKSALGLYKNCLLYTSDAADD